jgi:hypothetical protein
MRIRTRTAARAGKGSNSLRLLLAATAGAVFLFGLVGQAQAHHDQQGRIGTYVPKHSSCEPNNQIVAHAPQMYAAWGGGPQWVAFKTQLQELTQYGWRKVDSAAWKYTVVNTYEFGAYQWVAQDGRPVFASHRFTVPRLGRYRLVTEYYWFADQTRPWGSISDVNPVHDNRAGYADQSTYTECKFPGPNYLTIIG